MTTLTTGSGDYILRTALEISPQVVFAYLQQACASLERSPGDMGRNKTVAGMEERRIATGRLLAQHIDTGSVEHSAVQRIGQGLFIDHGATRSIDKYSSRLHQRQALSIDELAGIGSEWTVQAHHIGGGKQLVKRLLGNTLGQRILRLGGIGCHMHTEGLREAGNGHARAS